MKISAIVARSENNVIGKENDLPWHLPADLKYFKKTTLNHHVIMGRKVFESIGKPLVNRTNIILTRNKEYGASGAYIVHSISEALNIANQNGEEEAMILGGGEIYAQTLSLIDRLYITEVHTTVKGDTFFPAIDNAKWKLVSEEFHEKDAKNPYDYTFKILERV